MMTKYKIKNHKSGLWCEQFLFHPTFLIFFCINEEKSLIIFWINCSVKLLKNALYLWNNFIYILYGCYLSLLLLIFSLIFGFLLNLRVRCNTFFKIMKHYHKRVDSIVTSFYPCLAFLLYEFLDIVKAR